MKWLERYLPWVRGKHRDLNQASRRVTITIHKYREASRELQEEIEHNHFARYLIYDKGD